MPVLFKTSKTFSISFSDDLLPANVQLRVFAAQVVGLSSNTAGRSETARGCTSWQG